MAAAMTAICSCTPSTQKVDRQTEKQDDYYVLEKIAETKMRDLNAADIDSAISMIAGTCRSMGIEVAD